MTIQAAKEPKEVIVLIDNKSKTVTPTAHLAAANPTPPEDRRKCHCSDSDNYNMLSEWGRTCVKSDWLSVVKSCSLCFLLAWICWLQWSYHQLSVDVSNLQKEMSFSSRVAISGFHLEKDPNSREEEGMNIQPDNSDLDVEEEHWVYKHSAKKKRRKRQRRDVKIRESIKEYMMNNTYAMFLPGTNDQRAGKDYFKWNFTYANVPDEFITYNLNGTFTFKREGFYLVASQVTLNGIPSIKNSAVSYGYKTVLSKGANYDDEVLMRSEITQDRRGTVYDDVPYKPTDSISHLVMRRFVKGDQVAIATYTNGIAVTYYLTETNSYIAIVALDLLNF